MPREAHCNPLGLTIRIMLREDGADHPINGTPAADRQDVAHLVEHYAMSERPACNATGCCRMTVRYQSARPDYRALRERMIAVPRERQRFGYRRLHVLLNSRRPCRESQAALSALSRGEAGGAPAWRA